MALTDESNGNGFYMPVAPAYAGGNNGFGGFGGDGWWIILLLLACGGGWGFGGGFGGYGGVGGMYEFPWLLNGQAAINANTNAGFDHAATQSAIVGIQSGIGDISTQLCGGFAGVTAAVNNSQNAIAQQLYSNQIADLERSFAAQTANTAAINSVSMGLQNCCCENRANIADLKYTVATENCADRAALADGLRDVLAATQAQTQTILDKMCQDKLDAKNDEIAQLRQEILYARGQASQVAQNQQVIDGIYNRLDSCPVGTTPVYGRTPIFSCNNGGCGCNNGFAN